MATYGLKDLYRAPITTDTEGVETYGTPVRLAKAIEAGFSVDTAEGRLDADDAIDVIVKEFVKGTLTLKVNDLTPADIAILLGQTQDSEGVVYAGDTDDAPYWAIGFRAIKPGGGYSYIWLYKVKFSIPDQNYKTRGESIEFNTPELEGDFIKRPDGKWKAEAVSAPDEEPGASWFKAVREFKEAG